MNEMISNWNASYEKAKGLRKNNQKCQVQRGRPAISCMVRDGLSDEAAFQLRERASRREDTCLPDKASAKLLFGA